jgi:hypothetical protein
MGNSEKERTVLRLRILIEKVWAYAVEVIAAGLVCLFLLIWLGEQAIAKWQVEKRTDLLTFVGAAAAASAAVFAAYFGILSTDFGRKLRIHGVAAEYASAFAFPLIMLTIAAATLEFLTKDSGVALSDTVTFLLCYSCLNCITMVRNVLGVVRLWQEVERVNGKGRSV